MTFESKKIIEESSSQSPYSGGFMLKQIALYVIMFFIGCAMVFA